MESFKEFIANQVAPDGTESDGNKTGQSPTEDANSDIVENDLELRQVDGADDSIQGITVNSEDSESPEEAVPQMYPLLSNNPPDSPPLAPGKRDEEDDEEGLDISKSFNRTTSPTPSLKRNKGARVGKVGEEGVTRMHKFTLHETANYYYIVGSDLLDSAFRILKIDRTSGTGELNITEDDIIYTKKETQQILSAIDEGNRATGGLKMKTSFWGLLGFIRFTAQYYMIYVTKRSQVAMIGGHYIYQIDKTDMMPLVTAASTRVKTDRHLEEARFIGILGNLDLTRSFYFSYSYDVTRTLQHNITRERQTLFDGLAEPLKHDQNDMFIWNHHLLEPAKQVLKNPFDWCLSIVHGYVDQSALSIYWGRVVYVTIIARRSRFFAGARFLKRGANDLGYVANDVETEQIVSEMLTTSFHAPGPTLFANDKYTSYVQHRGSIPLHWTQDSTGVSPKPDIHLNVVDPFFSAAALHFDNLFKRYGTPIYVLNLIKSRERTPRESKLLKEYTLAVNYLNQFLPKDKQILYHAWDMSRASKSRDGDVIASLEAIAEGILPKTGFFQNGNDEKTGLKLQSGVARTNCIDCLDRTNAAQFVIAKKALGYQLQALGVIEDTSVEYDSDAINLFTHMWHDHGDTIAVQYGGSHLVNTMATYRKINQWTSHSRDMVESFKRYYNNSFMDAQRQEAYNLFLGNYVFAHDKPMLWDLTTDYYLHHSDPRSMFGKRRPSYRQWYTSENLVSPSIPPSLWPRDLRDRPLGYFDDYWVEYYRPLAITSFKKLFSFKMHSNLRYIPINSTSSGKYDFSPFKVRTANESDGEGHEKHAARKGVKIVAPSDDALSTTAGTESVVSSVPPHSALEPTPAPKPNALGPWLDAQQQLHNTLQRRQYTGIIKEPSFEVQSPSVPKIPKLPTATTSDLANSSLLQPTKAELALQSFTSLITRSLDPQVRQEGEYQRYVRHPSNIPLVVSSDIDYSSAPLEFLEYLSKTTSDPADHKVLRHYDDDRGAVSLTMDERAEASLDDYTEYLASGTVEDPLTVLHEDGEKKRYKAYKKWLKGKSLFKQRPVVGDDAAEGVKA
ncbi:phosphatidylinositol-3,5-bisphosphate 5-phosphatase [Knufia peltigerae]|uniref:Phosphatidylinositol-3,5-bisphosphate 5-phosphatase n=1 Tax=Knufia peltigerae TaxID=1002370 RepID=A0AA38Y864_9EURO|nr:phosphatidylinositol-3,5-bisphosphate 5-phosphatase [Knufia peltigerae]